MDEESVLDRDFLKHDRFFTARYYWHGVRGVVNVWGTLNFGFFLLYFKFITPT